MTILILHLGPGAKSLIVCDNCGLKEERLTCTCKKSILHFCDAECKLEHQTHKKRGGYRKSINDLQYRHDRGEERKDAKLKIQDKVKKKCFKCNRIYYGPPGGFPKGRDSEEPERGLCDVCSKHIPYDEGESAGVVNG